MPKENPNYNPDRDDDSMRYHPQKKAPMTILYHPSEAPKGRTLTAEQAASIDGKDGWVDSPAKFPKTTSKSQDASKAKTDQIVEAAVKEEKKRQAKAKKSEE